ncbi:ribosomal protein S5 domain 2-type protein [Tuber borchii]|uniref:Galactokinase n=1 Tax=Tuber borchii TaxID=42251 RepID=A0A2T7A7Z2_TUBBO|nr:ribosomal protein S5 domain 2-type protein [Tuber borchii]
MSEPVPEVLTIEEIYPPEFGAAQKQRWERLLAEFKERYGAPAHYIARSPGRVNIIGEHIDYMLFSVLPMAISSDFLLAVRVIPNTNIIKIANVLEKFPQREFQVPAEGELEIDATQLEWSNYFRSGLRGALELLRGKGLSPKNVGMEILANGNVPSGAGLSSSAAFTCASALASLAAMGDGTVDKKELVNLAVVSERYVGVNSGGMDQSASVLGVQGSALYISFHPTLDAIPVAFPKTSPELTFVIADTLVTADKHTTGTINYNLRVVECTLAAQILAKKLNLSQLPKDAGPLGNSLKGLMDQHFFGKDLPLDRKLEALIEVTKKHLDKEEGYTREEMAEILDLTVEELVQRCMVKFPILASHFQLRSRALHVLQEAHRVVTFKTLLDSSPPDPTDTKITIQLGAIMNESHESCKNLYNCSCPELDTLCEIARLAGSYGSRLTGAGWGGCSVHLVPQDKVHAVKEAWRREYYEKKFPGIASEKVESAIVVSKPGSGAVLFRVRKASGEVI